MKTLEDILNEPILFNEKILACVENGIYDIVENNVDGIVIKEINHTFSVLELTKFYQSIPCSKFDDCMEYFSKIYGDNIIVKYISEYDPIEMKTYCVLVNLKGNKGSKNHIFSRVVSDIFSAQVPTNLINAIEK